MGRAIQKWLSDDGTEFESEVEMLIHELNLISAQEIDLFLNQNYPEKSVKRKEYAKLLQMWENSRNSNRTIAHRQMISGGLQGVKPTGDRDGKARDPFQQEVT